MSNTSTDQGILKPYLPRLAIEWLRESPDLAHRRVEGSLAFVDISGFTKMTERLARKGKVGAEEVTDVLSSTFTRLLDAAYDYGGGVIKWGGDAVLMLFTGDGHAPRACRSAFLMRQVLRHYGRIHTSAGVVTLRMSVGIHSGAFDFFLVGGSHRELLVVGPGATQTAVMETVAEAGEIAVSPDTARLLPPEAVGRAKGPARLLKLEPQVSTSLAPVVEDVRGLPLADHVPVGLRDHLLSGASEAEHRHVGIAFIQFRGTDRLLEQDGAGPTAAALDRLIRTVQEAAEEHGVAFHATDIDKDGGKILVIAGAPTSSGNDEERLLRTMRAVVDAGHRLELRIGLNAGHIFSGEFGPPYRRNYATLGDAVNLAARIMAKAEAGQILATEPVLARSRTVFRTRPLEPFLVKGKKHPVQAIEVGPMEERSVEPAVRADLPLIGRDEELAALLGGLEAARSGSGRLVELVGEPGMGKSRLLEELRRAAGDTRYLSVACDEYESSTAYAAFRPLLRSVLGIPPDAGRETAGRILLERVGASAGRLVPWAPLLAMPADASVPPTEEVDRLDVGFKKARLEQVTVELLRTLLREPLALVFEDVHWMDSASGDLLRQLASDAATRPWLITVSRREEARGFHAPEGPATSTFHLAPLTGQAAAALAAAASEDSPLSPRVLAALAERSGGNPLFLQELVSASRTGGNAEALPSSVEALLAAQIDRLAGPDRTLLRYASVLGTTFDAGLLEAALADAAPRDPAVWGRLQDFVVADAGAFRFRHALIREVAYEGLPYRRRREVHGRVGETIEVSAAGQASEHAELLSLHFFEAAKYDKAWTYSRIAGERARSKFANLQAAGFYRRAAAAARSATDVPPTDLVQVYQALGDVCELAGQYQDAAAAYRSARQLVASDPVAQARLLLKEGIVRDRAGSYAEAMRWYRRGLRLLEVLDGSLEAAAVRAQLSVWYAAARRQQGRLRDSLKWCGAAIAEAERAGEKDALAHAYRLLDWTYTDLHKPEAARCSDLALHLYEELGNLLGVANVLNDQGVNRYFEGRWDEAMALYRRSREFHERVGDDTNLAQDDNNIAEILSDQGRLVEAEEMFRKALSVWRASGYRIGVAWAMSNLGRVAARAGRHEEAVELFDGAIVELQRIGAERQAVETRARKAESLVFQGRAAEAELVATAALERAEELGGMDVVGAMLHRLIGYASIQRGNIGAARASLERSLSIARAANAEYEVGLTLHALIDLSDLTGEPRPPAIQAEARSIFQRLGVGAIPTVPLPTLAPSPELGLAPLGVG